MTGTLMAALDVSIVNVTLPHMRGSLNASIEEITWVATGYMLSNVIIMPLIPFFASRFGRKRFLMFSVLLFTGGSIMCGMVGNMISMVSFRIIRSIGGSALMPVSQIILRETFPPEEQGMAMGIFRLGVVMGPAIGPTVGGWFWFCRKTTGPIRLGWRLDKPFSSAVERSAMYARRTTIGLVFLERRCNYNTVDYMEFDKKS